MNDIAIYGAGGFGKEVACLIGRLNGRGPEPRWRLVGFFDDGKPAGAAVSHYGAVLGGIEALNAWPEPLAVVIAIGSPAGLKAVAGRIDNDKVTFPNLVDGAFYVVDPATFTMGRGNIIMGDSAVSCDVSIGDFNVFNGQTVVGHDVTMGNFNVVMPAVNISGGVTIGNGNLLGVKSVVLQQIAIGDGVRLAAGSVLMTRPRDGGLYIGVPAKRFKF